MKHSMPDVLPNHATKVYDGILVDVYQWEQELFDGNTATFEKAVRQPGSQMVAVLGPDQILMCSQIQPGDVEGEYVSLPGGRVEAGETHEETAIRETIEETGYEAQEVAPWLQSPPFGHVYMDLRIYIGRNLKKVGESQSDAGEKISCRVYSFDEFIALGVDSTFHHALLKVELLEAYYSEKKRNELKERFWPTK